MIYPVVADIVELLKQLANLLQPITESHGILLAFRPKENKALLFFRPDQVIVDLTNLICNITGYMQQGNVISITGCTEGKEYRIKVKNTGINLSSVREITQSCKHPLIVVGNSKMKQTRFEMSLPFSLSEENQNISHDSAVPVNKLIIPEYYDEIRKRLRSHFSKADNLVAQLSILYPREAAFLQRVNAVIVANMENELFDAAALGREMNMSRTSLFRRLKPLIQRAPSAYIKSIRLQKAKDLLEVTDISVGDAAFKTGFRTQSHFTKAFTEMFGFLPSSIRRKDRTGTK